VICYYCLKTIEKDDVVVKAAIGGSESEPPCYYNVHKRCAVSHQVVLPTIVFIGFFLLLDTYIVFTTEPSKLQHFWWAIPLQLLTLVISAVVLYKANVKDNIKTT
jgi:hypothetical protein